jgi:tetratricopeptide (TPR) repeat protein
MPFSPRERWVRFSAVAVVGLASATARAQPPTRTDEPIVASPEEGEAPADESFTYDSRAVEQDAFEEARLLFLAGRRAFDGGRFEDALDSFRRAHELTGDPHLLYDIAVTLDRLRRDREALEAFALYLEREPESPDRRDVEARMRILREHLAAREVAREPDPTPHPATPVAPPDEADDDGGGPSPWLWTLVAIAVLGAGAAAIAAVVVTNRPDPTPGSEGVVLYGLRW